MASYIIEKCKALTNEKRVLVQVSLLHKFNINNCPDWLRNYKSLTNRQKIKKRITKSFGKSSEKNPAKYFLIADYKHPNRIANYTLTLIDGKIIAIYRKSTYCEEADKYVHTTYDSTKYAYEFGDFRNHILEASPFSKFFIGENPPVVTRMCSDMNCPHIKANSSSKLVIVHANGHPLIEYADFHKLILFVDDQGICMILPNGIKTGISWKNIPKTDGYICGHLDLSILNDFPNTPYALIKLDNIQGEIK